MSEAEFWTLIAIAACTWLVLVLARHKGWHL